MFIYGPSVPCERVAYEDIWFLTERDWSRVLSWQRHNGCHFVSFVMYISGAKFKEHCLNISRDIHESCILLFWLNIL